jgi:hypothetical protein
MVKQNARKSTTFFVATDGNDSWSGKLPQPSRDGTEGPFATLERARNAIRKIKLSGKFSHPIEVQVRGGTYHFSRSLRLSPGDSGSPECPIAYCAYPGEKPVLSGGKAVDNWRVYKDKIWCAHLTDVKKGLLDFKQLFYKGKRMIRSRYPKADSADPLYGGWTFVTEPVAEAMMADEVSRIELGPEWQFKLDPEKRGMADNWFNPSHATDDWEKIESTTYWQHQGWPDYHGRAWYRLELTVPQDFKPYDNLWLCFGGVDKEAFVYVDGEKVFEHSFASTGLQPGQICDRPFKFDAKSFFVPGKKHTVVVCVDSESGVGGIFTPVFLVSAEHELSPDQLANIDHSVTAFKCEKEVLDRSWAKPEQGDVFIFPGKCWTNDIVPIEKINDDTGVMHLTRPIGPYRPGSSLAKVMNIVAGNRFRVENILEELTEPGEWCLDRETGTVYFWPPDAFDHQCVTVPVNCRVIEMAGSARNPLTNVIVEGLTFTQTLSNFPNPNSYYKTPNAGQALYLENTADCVVRGNHFDQVGGDAIRLQGANSHNSIIDNEITGAGATGIFVGSVRRGFCRGDAMSGDVPSPGAWHDSPEDRQTVVEAWPRTSGHIISNNRIRHVGLIEKHASGIAFYGVSAPNVTVSHNTIEHSPRFGIGLMSGFGRVIIEHNSLRHISEETCDTGGICANRWYTYDRDPELSQGNIIRFNHIIDVIGCGAYGTKAEPGGQSRAGGRIWPGYYSWAIYFDNAPMDVLVRGNICAGNSLGGIMISHYGKNVTVENNIFADSDKSQIYLLFAGQMQGIRFRRNIFSYTNPQADFIRLNLAGAQELTEIIAEFDDNVIYNAAGTPPTILNSVSEALQRTNIAKYGQAQLTYELWKKAGYDSRSLLIDPEFIDPDQGDYLLNPNSPALKLGFEPIKPDLGESAVKDQPATS